MLHDEVGLHAELGPFLDGERFRFQRFDGAGGGQIDGDVGAAFDLEGERFDDAATLVLGVHVDGGGGGDAERGFPAVEGLVILVWVRPNIRSDALSAREDGAGGVIKKRVCWGIDCEEMDGDACKRRGVGYVCGRSPIWRQRRGSRRHSSIIDIASRA